MKQKDTRQTSWYILDFKIIPKFHINTGKNVKILVMQYRELNPKEIAFFIS